MDRLIDLHTDWLLQYALETNLYGPELYPRVAQRLDQAEGYLGTTRAAILSCYRNVDDWASRADPWAALAELLTRIEAEFSGRLLIGPEDFQRWHAETDGLCWGMIGVEGFDALIRSTSDLDRLSSLFERGVRLFQPVYTSTSVLAGSSAAGDDRGLLPLGRDFLEILFQISPGADGPRPILDLAHLNPKAASEVLDWFEADADRPSRLIPVYSHGGLWHEGFQTPRAITRGNLARLRALGGVIGFGVTPPFYESSDALKAGLESAAEVPFQGRSGFEGIAIGTDFLGVDRTIPGLGNAPEVVAWIRASFDPKTASALLYGSGETLIRRALGPIPLNES